MPTKLEVENLTKIFGENEKEALELTQQGVSKNDILSETGATVGVHQAGFVVKEIL